MKENKHKFTTYIPSIDTNIGREWTFWVYSCLESYIGKENTFTVHVYQHISKGDFSKKSIEIIVSLLSAAAKSIEQGDIKVENMTKDECSDKVFIVHGHDEEAAAKVENCIRKIELTPIVLRAQPNKGETVFEKIERYTDVGFGIVLYTPCDKTFESKFRARQNVVLEHGYLMGKLGRSKVCALVKGDVEMPSDIDGIVYIKLSASFANP